MKHTLKTDSYEFQATYLGIKPWEVRYNDRNFQVGDELILKETQFSGYEMVRGAPLVYTGREIQAKVLYILHGDKYGLLSNFCIMSIGMLDQIVRTNDGD
jgi:hypothetical protein